MGYRGKLVEQERARELRAQSWTMPEIAEHLGVSKSSVSLWTRDVEFTPKPRKQQPNRNHGARTPRKNKLHDAKLAEIARLNQEGVEQVGVLTRRDLLLAGLGLYAGDGRKGDGEVRFANSDPTMIALFCRWLRAFFDVDERRLRVRLYLHEGLDLEAATRYWSELTAVSETQFTKPYRAVPDAGIRHNKHEHGCAHVSMSCSRTQRQILGLMRALLVADVEPANPFAPGAGLEPATTRLTIERSAY